MNHIIPAIIATDEQDFRIKFTIFKNTADTIQLDVLDGTLYPNTSWCDITAINNLVTSAWIELHLMVKNPLTFIKHIKKDGAIQRAIWHIEANIDHAEMLIRCSEIGIESGLAIAPQTSIEALRPFAEMLDEILVLGVEPGFSGQTLLPETIQKAQIIHDAWPATIIGFDGGVTTKILPKIREVGITRFYTASAIWRSADPKAAFEELKHS